MTGPRLATNADGSRLHLHHGPIDLIIEAWGPPDTVTFAYRAAWCRFRTILDELVDELPLLRRPIDRRAADCLPRGPVAARMTAAITAVGCGQANRVTPMAAVAGAVADEVLAAMVTGPMNTDPPDRAFVNNGGDISLHLEPGQSLAVGMVPDPGLNPEMLGPITITDLMATRGVATSGRHGRSFTTGIADAVTVLGPSAAAADAAATLIAGAVDLPGHPAVRREAAAALDPDTDLGDTAVTVAVGCLTSDEIAAALDRGRAEADRIIGTGSIAGAVLCLDHHLTIAGIGSSRAHRHLPPPDLPTRAGVRSRRSVPRPRRVGAGATPDR